MKVGRLVSPLDGWIDAETTKVEQKSRKLKVQMLKPHSSEIERALKKKSPFSPQGSMDLKRIVN